MPGEACWPCRERKVKCDAAATGVPCSRCRSSCRVDCYIPPKQKRKIRKAFRRSRNARTNASQPHEEPVSASSAANHVLAEDHSAGVINANTESHESEDVLCSTAYGISQLTGAHAQDDDRIDPALSTLPFPKDMRTGDAALSEENEDDVLARVCQKIASGKANAVHTATARMWTESIEYQNSFSATGILGEVLARKSSNNRLIKINYNLSSSLAKGEYPQTRRDVELLGLDDHERAFLLSKGVFELPSKPVCLEFFGIYFRYAFPYAPVIDRGELLALFDKQEHSSFLVQAILANVVPYCDKDLVSRSGFPDHAMAQKTFYKRAVLLYDFNCEKSQLVLLQGSLLLGTQWLSYFSDKDYQFWMCNAIRIAARMGIHRRHIEEHLEPKFYKLLKRIWWTISIRDVLTTISGLDNGRPALPRQCDTSDLVEEDWPDEDTCPMHMRGILPSTQLYHMQFFIQLSRLSRIGSTAHHSILSRKASELDRQRILQVIDDIFEWKQSLPSQLRVESVKHWREEGLWILVLMAWCYRMECNLYRSLRKCMDAVENGDAVDIDQRLHTAIFELDTTVRRAVTHQIGRLLPMSFSTAVATLVALCIEILLKPSLAKSDKLMCEEAIRTGMAFLADSQETWSCLRWMTRMFRWALRESDLEFLYNCPNDLTESQERSRSDIFDDSLIADAALPFERRGSSDFLWESAFLSDSGIPDWQEWLDL